MGLGARVPTTPGALCAGQAVVWPSKFWSHAMTRCPRARRVWIYALENAYLTWETSRFREDLPQSLDEPAHCHSELHKDFLLGGAPEWCPFAGKLDEALRVGVRMNPLTVDFDPSGATSLAPLAILTRVHANLQSKCRGSRALPGGCRPTDGTRELGLSEFTCRYEAIVLMSMTKRYLTSPAATRS